MNANSYNNSNNVRLRLRCPEHGKHGPFELSRDTLRENSKVLEQSLSAPRDRPAGYSRHQGSPSLPPIDTAGRGFSCQLLESIIFTWKNGRHVRSTPPLDDFFELYQLACALVEFQCSTSWFIQFARDVRLASWDHDAQEGRNSPAWAFVAVVFNWPDVFGLSIMDIPYLGQDQPEGRFSGSYEYRMLRRIVRK
jgi:hypothetical protein